MFHIDWYAVTIIGVILIIGAVIGALLQSAIAASRTIKPIINTRIDVLAKFDPLFESHLLDTYKIVVTDGAKEYKYNSLAQVEIYLNNKSLQDFPEFKVGVKLANDDVAIYAESHTDDRHHHLKLLTPVTLNEPQSEMDFLLQPFNRGDSYSLRLLIKLSEDSQVPGEISITSPEAVSFINLPTIAEIVEQAASRASIGLGPFQISLGQ
ncbi:MAG: hypothetical protein U7127_05355 [Phormidium sp.]